VRLGNVVAVDDEAERERLGLRLAATVGLHRVSR
jgi:hypothetical protein